jgi:type I restriction enzyme S subunit
VTPNSWRTVQLQDCLDKIIDYRGKSPPKSDRGVPLITARNVREGFLDFATQEYIHTSEYDQWMSRGLPKAGDLLFTTEAPLGMVALFPEDGKYAIAQRLVNLRAKQGMAYSKYLLYYFLSERGSHQVQLRSTGSTATGIRQSELRRVPVLLPPFLEQLRITKILSAWDKAIALTEQRIEAARQRKKGLTQRLLTGRVRFPEFEGEEWRTIRFRDVFQRVTRKNENENQNVLTMSAQLGLVSQTEYFNKRVASRTLSHYYLLKRGEFAYNKSYSSGSPFGALKRLDAYDEGVLSTLYICFRLKDAVRYDSDFFVHFFEAGQLNRGIYAIAQEGARSHGLLNISISDFFDLTMTIPSYEEQKRIASVLNACDREIELLTQKHDALQRQKKGLMQRLLTGRVRVKV